jgi:hypothetical protein
MKSGLEIFDTCRAYGLAQLLRAVAQGTSVPTITDWGIRFSINIPSQIKATAFEDFDEWKAIFSGDNWQRVFLTYKRAWSSQRDKVKKSLERRVTEILVKAETDGLTVGFEGKFVLPGPLDPVGFKGLKGMTAGSYSEGQTTVDELNWALGCLGAAVAQRYKIQKAVGNKWEYFVTVPVPEEVRFSDFHKVRQIVYDKGLAYNGVRNAAAHFSLLLAYAIREKGQGNPHFPARFSNVFYFSLFQSGQQFKPSVGGVVNVGRLIEIALSRPDAALEMFKTWDYLFRRGSAQGNEDLAQAITELVMVPSLETYYRHARIFNRYVVDRNKGVKRENLYTERALEEVMHYVQ